MNKAIPATIAIAAWAAGCAGSDSVAWAGTVTDSAGVSLISNPAQGMWSESDAWTVEPVVTIGAAEGEAELQFGQIVAIAVDRSGRIHVLDQQASNVRTFDPDGAFVRTIGRKGSGPGEIQNAAGLFMGTGDTLFVADIGARRVSRFLTDGSEAGSFPLSLTNGIPIRWDGTEGGTLVAQLRPFTGGPGAGAPAIGESDVVVSMGSDGSLGDTLLTMPAGETIQFRGPGQAPRIQVFAPEPIWALAPDGIWFGINNEFRVSRYSNGELTSVITREGAGNPVTEADERMLMRAIERVMRASGQVPPAAIEQVMQSVEIGDNFPAFLQLRAGPDQSLWVQKFADLSGLSDEERAELNPLTGFGSDTWEVFDDQGRYLGDVEMPKKFQPLLFRQDMVYGVWRDDLDVQYVMAAHILTG